MNQRHREILKLLAAGGTLLPPQRSYARTYRLRMPADPYYGGQVVREGTVRAMRAHGLLDNQLGIGPKAGKAGGLAPATSIR